MSHPPRLPARLLIAGFGSLLLILSAPAIAVDARAEKLAEIRRVALREAQDVLRDAAAESLAQHATLTSLLIGMFGVLITSVIVFFALRTEKAAVFEARQIVDVERVALNALRIELQGRLDAEMRNVGDAQTKLRADGDTILSEITTLYGQAEAEANDRRARMDAADANLEARRSEQMLALEAQVEAARTHMARLTMETTSHTPLSEIDQQAIDAASRTARNKSSANRNSRDFLAMIAAAIQSDNAALVLELAGQLEESDTTAEAHAYGAYYAGYARFAMREYEAALEKFRSAAGHLGTSEIPEMKYLHRKARFNAAQTLLRMQRYAESEAEHRLIVEEVGEDATPESRHLTGGAHHGIAHAQDELGRTEEAIETLRTASTYFGDDPDVRGKANKVLYDLACAMAKLERFEDTAITLRLATSRGLEVSKKLIRGDRELAAFLTSASGIALLVELPETGTDDLEIATPHDT